MFMYIHTICLHIYIYFGNYNAPLNYLYLLTHIPREEALTGVGIAGIKNPDSVKCLHTHYAHYLSRPEDGNLIGLWVHELYTEQMLTSA